MTSACYLGHLKNFLGDQLTDKLTALVMLYSVHTCHSAQFTFNYLMMFPT